MRACRGILMALVMVGHAACWRATPPAPASAGATIAKPAPPVFADYVVAGKRTSAALNGAIGLGDGTVAVLACLQRGANVWMPFERMPPVDDTDQDDGGWPIGASLGKLDGKGKIVARARLETCGGLLVHAGEDLVRVNADRSRLGQPMRIERWNDALEPAAGRATVTAAVPGSVTAVTGRADGAVVIATLLDTYQPTPGAAITVLAPDGREVAHWLIAGQHVQVDQVMADGDGAIVAGWYQRSATFAPDLVLGGQRYESAFIARVGPSDRWGHDLGAPELDPVTHQPPRFVGLPDGFAVAWAIHATVDTRPHPDLAAYGGMPPAGDSTVWATLDAEGRLRAAHYEPQRVGDTLAALVTAADGAILEVATVQHRLDGTEDQRPPDACAGRHGCRDTDGPNAFGHTDAIVVRRRDPKHLAVAAAAAIGGAMIARDVSAIIDGRGVIVLGTAVGAIDLKRGRVKSALQVFDPCGKSQARPAAALGLYAAPPPDPCRVHVLTHSLLFATHVAP